MNVWTIVATLLSALVGALSPQIKKLLDDFLNDLYQRAVKTTNPVDDILVKFLADMLGVEIE